jgi:hypothetical protein
VVHLHAEVDAADVEQAPREETRRREEPHGEGDLDDDQRAPEPGRRARARLLARLPLERRLPNTTFGR